MLALRTLLNYFFSWTDNPGLLGNLYQLIDQVYIAWPNITMKAPQSRYSFVEGFSDS